MRTSLCLLCLFTISGAALTAQDAPLPWANPADVGFSSEGLDAIPAAMQGYVDRGAVGGVVTMVARRGQLVHWESVGFGDLDSGAPLEPDDIFRIYSMTKPVTSVAVMMLVEEGAIALDDELSTHLPAFADMKVYSDGDLVPVEHPITIRDMLSHMSGITYGLFGFTPVDVLYREADVFSGDLASLAEKVARLPLLGHPGTAWNYSLSADVLGHVVEVLSGQSFDDFLRARIFEPLDMEDTGFFVPPEKTDRFTNMYSGAPGSLQVSDPSTGGTYDSRPELLSGGGGLVSTASDYVRFAQMLLNGGELDGARLLRPETVELMRTNRLPESLIPIRISAFWSAPGYGFGLGFSVLTDADATPEPDNTGVFRWWGIGSTYFWIDPVAELIGLVMTQLNPPTAPQIEKDFQTLVYEALRN